MTSWQEELDKNVEMIVHTYTKIQVTMVTT